MRIRIARKVCNGLDWLSSRLGTLKNTIDDWRHVLYWRHVKKLDHVPGLWESLFRIAADDDERVLLFEDSHCGT